MKELHARVAAEVGKVVVGQDEALEDMLAALALGGHVLLEGVPGVAKTLLASATARALGVEFRRLQFTPDMLPSDVTGTMALRARRARIPARAGVRRRRPGRRDQPHAAEDPGRAAGGDAGGPGHRRRRSRTRCRTRSSCSPRRTRSSTRAPTRCPRPSATASSCTSRSATRAPTRSARCSGSPAAGSRRRRSTTSARWPSAEDLRAARAEVDATEVPDEVVGYVVAIVRRTRELPSVALGASPRAAVHLLGAAKAAARLAGRAYVDPGRRRPHGRPGPAPPPRPHARGRARARDPEGRDPHRARGRSRCRDEPDGCGRSARGAPAAPPSRMTPAPRAVVALAVIALALLVPLGLWRSAALALLVARRAGARAGGCRRSARRARGALARRPCGRCASAPRRRRADGARAPGRAARPWRSSRARARRACTATMTPRRRGRHVLPAGGRPARPGR